MLPDVRVMARAGSEKEVFMAKDTLTIIDNRTGRSYEVEVREGAS